MKQSLLFWTICLCLVLPQTIHSQTICPDPLTALYNNAPPGCTICDFPFTSNNFDYFPSGSLAAGDYGCGQLGVDNEQYFVFIANDPCVSFTIDAYNCISGGGPPAIGLQGFIFDLALTTTFVCAQGCCGTPNSSPPPCSSDSPAFTISTCELTIGTTYYLIIDGCAGSECDYEITSTGTQGGDFVTISPTGPFCTNDDIVTLEGNPTTGTTGTGVWTGDVNANGEFDAAALGEGNYSATYTFTNTYGCEGEQTLNFVIEEPTPVSIDEVGSVCINDFPFALDADPLGGTWGGAGSGGTFIPSSLGLGTHIVTYTLVSGGCTNTDEISIIIYQSPTVDIAPLNSLVCSQDEPFNLTATPIGGTWNGDVSPSGTMDPAALGEGSFSAAYVYTDDNDCTSSDIINFEILPALPVEIIPQTSLCETDAITALTGIPEGGTWLGDVNENGEIEPATLGVGDFTAIYEIADANGCTGTANLDFTIFPLPSVEITPIDMICQGDSIEVLTANPEGGLWGGTVSETGEFDPEIAGVGTHIITYSFTDSNSCTAIDSLQLSIFPQTILTFNNTGPWCLGVDAQTIEANPTGGLWSGAANELGEVLPQDLGAGLHEVTYEFTDSNGCLVDSTFSIEVSQTVTLQIDSLPPLCADGNIEQLSADPSGGVWGGAASETGEVNPVTLGIGLHIVTYEVTDGEGCVFNGEREIEVLAPVEIEFLSTDPFCLEDVTTIVEANPTGGIWSGDVNEFGEFNPTTLGSGVHNITYSYEDFAGCVVTASSIFTIAEPLEITFGNSVFCQSETSLVTLSASPSNGNWSGDIISSNGEINPSSLDLGEYTVTYTAVQLPEGCNVSQDLNISIIGISDLEILGDTSFCQTSDSPNFTATPTGGTWSGVADASGNVDVSGLSVGTHEVIYTATSEEDCVSTISQEITIAAPPTASLSGNPTMCEGGETTLDISLKGTAPWTVTYTLESGTEMSLTIENSPYEWTVNQGGEYNLISVEDANNCTNTATGTATVTELAPLQIVNISSSCNGTNTGFIVEFEIIGGDPATYSVNGITGNLTSDAPYIFTSEDIPTGDTANFTVSDDSPCEDINDAVTVLDCDCETDAGSLEEVAFEVCVTETVTVSHNADEFLDDNDVLMFVLYAGTPNNVETVLVLTDGTTFGFDETLMESGVTYYIAAIAGNDDGLGGIDLGDSCLNYSTGMPVFFNALPTATIGQDQTICEGEEATLVLTLEGEAPFTVTLDNGAVLTDIPNGFEYVLTPVSDTTIAVEMVTDQNCENTASSQAIIEVNLPPLVELNPQTNICNTNQNNDPTTLNLNDLILSGDATGTWLDLDASGATGTSPNLDFNGVSAGDYTFEYTTAVAIAPCENVTYTTTISVLDCSCPDVGILGAGPFCNDAAILDLATITTTTEAGMWSITNAPINSTATISGNTFDGNGSIGGDYELTFTLTEVAPTGCPVSASEIITLSEVITAGAIVDTIKICNDGNDLNLLDVLDGETSGGTWTDISTSPAMGFFNEGILAMENLPSGIYNFVYEVAGNPPCANDSEEVIVEVDTPVEAGTLLQNLEVCEGENTTINLFDLIEGYDSGGAWVDISTSPANDFDATGVLNTNALAVGNYAFSYQMNSNGICDNDAVLVAVNLNEIPIADAGGTSVLTCDEPTAMIGGIASSTGENITYLWSGTVEDSIVAITTTNLSGTYTLTVTDTESGCEAMDEVTITQEGAIPILSAVAFGLDCFNSNDGRIEIEGVTSGVEPYRFVLDGGNLTSETVFENLAGGIHTLEVIDANGCTDVLTFDIEEPEELMVSLALNAASNVIQLGDSVQIIPTFSGAFTLFEWISSTTFPDCDLELDSLACLNPWVQPTENTAYTLLIEDENTCGTAASIEVLVESEAKVIFPTAFSPNNDGINDEFRLFANSNAIRVQSLVIFDRWGEKVFERLDFDPTDNSIFWDGFYKGKEMEVGVFVYYSLVEFRDGSVDLFQGNLTLVR